MYLLNSKATTKVLVSRVMMTLGWLIRMISRFG